MTFMALSKLMNHATASRETGDPKGKENKAARTFSTASVEKLVFSLPSC